jgi:Uma2 family endonuclease
MVVSNRKREILLLEAGIRIPAGMVDLASFREWARSPEFPERGRGRIDWIQGRLEIEVSPEDVVTHGSLKSAIAGKLVAWIQEPRRGLVGIDSTRISSVEGDLSAEPDVVVLLESSLRSGKAWMVGRSEERAAAGRYLEIEGAPDLVVEVVSDSSTSKDRRRLREAYHTAGIAEYWIVDGRREPLVFELLLHRSGSYEEAPVDEAGYRRSEVLQRALRITRTPGAAGMTWFAIEERS